MGSEMCIRDSFITLDNSPVSDETAKGLFTIDPTVDHVSFENLTFSGAQNSSRNGAGIRHQGGDLTVTNVHFLGCLLYTSPSPRDLSTSRMPSSA